MGGYRSPVPFNGEISTPLRPLFVTEPNRRSRLLARSSLRTGSETPYRNGPLSHGVRRNRLPADNPVAALTCRLSCHSLPRLRFPYLQRESQGRFAPCAKQQFAAGQRLCKRNRRFPFWGKRLRDCQKRALPFFDKRIAVCCAHVLSAYSGQDAHLQPELYFLSGTCPDRK